jgi:hypothetical protein
LTAHACAVTGVAMLLSLTLFASNSFKLQYCHTTLTIFVCLFRVFVKAVISAVASFVVLSPRLNRKQLVYLCFLMVWILRIVECVELSPSSDYKSTVFLRILMVAVFNIAEILVRSPHSERKA